MNAPRATLGERPRNLTHCCDCDQAFPEPVTDWDDYFAELEDASFACAACAERESYPADPMRLW